MSATRTLFGGAALLLALAIAAAVAWLYLDYAHFVDAPLAVRAGGDSLEIERGMSYRDIVDDLHRRHLSAAPRWYWRALGERMGVADRLHAGEYALSSGITPRRLLEKMARGDVIQHRFTIVEGWTFDELRAALRENDTLKHAAAKLDDAALMQRLGTPGEAPEGRFLPETYAFVRGDSDIDILRRALHAMRALLQKTWPGRDDGIPLESPYQALILASIVEKETGRAGERARIAGVFERRLNIGMALQTDPTIIYGLGKSFDGNLRRSDLHADGPYNTYTRTGLPPTPIALPGRAAIRAVLHPAAGDALFFVSRGDGTHVFSATLAEHQRAVARYQLRRHH